MLQSGPKCFWCCDMITGLQYRSKGGDRQCLTIGAGAGAGVFI